jgi:hypothetical protein
MYLPKWLVDEQAITVATWGLVLVTLLLVVATVFLWLDSLQKGKEQRERWDTEDRRQAALASPKYRFGLRVTKPVLPKNATLNSTPTRIVSLWIGNFGQSALWVDQLFLKHREFAEGTISIDRLVAAGSESTIDLPDTFWEKAPGITGSQEGNFLYGDHELWLKMADAAHAFTTERILYFLHYQQHSFDKLERGSFEERQPKCPKCEKLVNGILPSTGLLTEHEVQDAGWRQVMGDLRNSCPNHVSALLKSLPEGPQLIDGKLVWPRDHA